jgi:hypothetical protein
MALREFSDSAGRQWRVWDVTADAIHPATRGEDYMRDYLAGWLAFESADGLAKCRLTPIPEGWTTASVEQLEKWLHAAETVRGDRGSGAFGRASAEVASNPLIATSPRGPVRTFRFPGGRYWTVTEYQTAGHGAKAGSDDTQAHRVLRFMSGARSLDLAPWPADWTSLSDAQLAELLTTSFPRHSDPSESSAQRRRSGDHEKR